MSKKKSRKFPVWLQFLLVILVSVFVGLWISGSFTNYNYYSDDYGSQGSNGYQDNNYYVDSGYEDNSYEVASEKWNEHADIIDYDIGETNRIIEQHCPEGMLYKQVPSCIDYLQPRLTVYTNHVLDAKDFLYQEGEAFSNTQTLLAGLDDDLVYIQSQANYLGTLTNDYNSWVQEQNYQSQISQQREQAVYDLLKILSGF